MDKLCHIISNYRIHIENHLSYIYIYIHIQRFDNYMLTIYIYIYVCVCMLMLYGLKIMRLVYTIIQSTAYGEPYWYIKYIYYGFDYSITNMYIHMCVYIYIYIQAAAILHGS